MYSFSQLKLYQSCPKQYEFRYLNTFENEEHDSLFLLQWTIIHETLRRLYQKISVFSLPKKEEVFSYFQSKREELLPQHSFLDLKDQTVTEAHQITKQQLSLYYDQQFPFEGETIIGLEQKLFAKLDERFTFSATIDRITKKDDTFIIYDYKTNKNLTPEILASHREQMYLYARALQQNYGKYFSHIEIHIEYLALQKTEIWTVESNELQESLQKNIQLCKEIETKKEQYKILNDPNLFPTQKGEICKRCSFMSICPAFSEWVNNELDAASLTAESIQHLVKEYAKDYQLIKSLELEKETLKQQLEIFFQSTEYQRIFGSEYQISYAQRDNRTIKDSDQVELILADKGLLYSSRSLDKTKLKKLIANGEVSSNLAEEGSSKSLSVKIK